MLRETDANYVPPSDKFDTYGDPAPAKVVPPFVCSRL